MSTAPKTQIPQEWLTDVISYFAKLGFWYIPDKTTPEEVAKTADLYEIFPPGPLDPTKLIDGRPPEQRLLSMLPMVNNRVWYRDAEADFVKGDYWYIRTILDWSRISVGCFQPQCLSELWLPRRTPDPEYPDQEEQPIEVSYLLGEKRWKFELLEACGWMDRSLVRKVNESIAGTGSQFALADGDDQCVYVCCLTMEEVENLKKERGWKFHEDSFCAR